MRTIAVTTILLLAVQAAPGRKQEIDCSKILCGAATAALLFSNPAAASADTSPQVAGSASSTALIQRHGLVHRKTLLEAPSNPPMVRNLLGSSGGSTSGAKSGGSTSSKPGGSSSKPGGSSGKPGGSSSGKPSTGIRGGYSWVKPPSSYVPRAGYNYRYCYACNAWVYVVLDGPDDNDDYGYSLDAQPEQACGCCGC